VHNQDTIRPLLVRRATESGLYGYAAREAGPVWRLALILSLAKPEAPWRLMVGWGIGRERGGCFCGLQVAWTGSSSYHLGWGWERSLPWRPWPYTHWMWEEHWTFAWTGFYFGKKPEGGRHPNDNHRRGSST